MLTCNFSNQQLTPFKEKLVCQRETVDKLISSSNDSNQVSHQAQQEEKQKGMEVELSDFQLCSAVKAEEDQLHPEPEMGEGTLE